MSMTWFSAINLLDDLVRPFTGLFAVCRVQICN